MGVRGVGSVGVGVVSGFGGVEMFLGGFGGTDGEGRVG